MIITGIKVSRLLPKEIEHKEEIGVTLNFI
jgi:hypothetical protein